MLRAAGSGGEGWGLEPTANERKSYLPNVGNVLSLDHAAGSGRLS
jgi:hypothetical protein